jgi:hypothetical protein
MGRRAADTGSPVPAKSSDAGGVDLDELQAQIKGLREQMAAIESSIERLSKK